MPEQVGSATDVESFPNFTKPARQRWESIPADIRQRLLSYVWCGQCHHGTTTTNFSGRIKGGDLLLAGKCERDLTAEASLLLSGWVGNYPELGFAYRFKEDFFSIYDAKSADEAQGRFLQWKSQITPEIAPAFFDLVRAWNHWTPWILEYFNHDHQCLHRVTEQPDPCNEPTRPGLQFRGAAGQDSVREKGAHAHAEGPRRAQVDHSPHRTVKAGLLADTAPCYQIAEDPLGAP